MAGRESAEEKIARVVRETMAGERKREEEEKDPRIGRMRQLIREEVGSVLGELLQDPGEGGRGRRRRRSEPEDDDQEGDGSIFSLFG